MNFEFFLLRAAEPAMKAAEERILEEEKGG